MTHAVPCITVFGSSTVREPEPTWRLAYDLGRELARSGATVITGGYSGTMEACSRGAAEAGGHVIGVTVELFEKRGPVNPWVAERVHAPDLFDRLRHLIRRADGFVALPGSLGTLAEVLLTWTLLSVEGRPSASLVLLGDCWQPWLEAHQRPDLVLGSLFAHVQVAGTPAEAARLAVGGVAAATRTQS
jgi:uncharacterized protein (TIGR00730 family)